MDETAPGIIRRPAALRRIDLGGFEVIVHAEAVDTDGAFSLIETAESDVGAGPPLHVHRDATESFVVLAGRYVMVLADREVECEAGSFILVPRGTPHTFRSATAGSRKLNLYTPAAMVGYFDELAAAIAAGMQDAALEAIAGRHHMDVVGPVPEGYLSTEPG
jgi:mannose-6-phosphate isomerase-like protein (cupin superfamily)